MKGIRIITLLKWDYQINKYTHTHTLTECSHLVWRKLGEHTGAVKGFHG